MTPSSNELSSKCFLPCTHFSSAYAKCLLPLTIIRLPPVVPPKQLGGQSKLPCKAVNMKARGYIIPISRSPTDSEQLQTTSSFSPSKEIFTIATNILETKANRMNTEPAQQTPGLKCNLKIKSNNFPPFEHTWNKISI